LLDWTLQNYIGNNGDLHAYIALSYTYPSRPARQMKALRTHQIYHQETVLVEHGKLQELLSACVAI